jgi:hypothetical protein
LCFFTADSLVLTGNRDLAVQFPVRVAHLSSIAVPPLICVRTSTSIAFFVPAPTPQQLARQYELIDDLPLVDLEHAKAAALNSLR